MQTLEHMLRDATEHVEFLGGEDFRTAKNKQLAAQIMHAIGERDGDALHDLLHESRRALGLVCGSCGEVLDNVEPNTHGRVYCPRPKQCGTEELV